MKKIINGKLYNTDTARNLGSYENIADAGNFHYFSEALYQKRTGEYFLHGQGGPMSRYAEAIDQNSWAWGERIAPLSVEAARKWAEEHLDADDYAAAFGMPDEGDDAVEAIHVQVSAAIMAEVRAQAAANGESLRAFVERALGEAVGKR